MVLILIFILFDFYMLFQMDGGFSDFGKIVLMMLANFVLLGIIILIMGTKGRENSDRVKGLKWVK